MCVSYFLYFKNFLFKIFIFVCVLILSCKNCDNKNLSNKEQISFNTVPYSQKEDLVEIINFGQDVFKISKGLAIIAVNSSSSFLSKENLFLDFIQTKGANFVSNLAPGPFSIDVFESISNETIWELKYVPDMFVWYSKNTGKGDFLITDAVGIPQKSFVKTILNGNELVSFLFLEEPLQTEKTYYIYFRQADKFSFVQNVKFIN